MGTTATFLKSRVSKPTVGKWSSGYSAVKKYADAKGIPIIGVWSNGDKCGHCINFEKSVMQSTFKKWMATSGCVFWFGYYGDTSKDDKFEGTGFTWARNGKLTMYPFVRVWWKAGKVDTCKSGDDWTGGSDKGGATFVKKLKSVLKNFTPKTEEESKPAEEPTPAPVSPITPPTDEDCNDCNCNTNCDEALKEIETLKTKMADVESQCAEIKSSLAALEASLK